LPDNNVVGIGGPSGTAGDGGGGSGGVGERLARLEEKVNHLATTKDASEIKELIMKNDSEIKSLVHGNQTAIQQQQMTNLKWGVGLLITSIIAIAAIVITVLGNQTGS